jgi:hypothetical protein
MFFAARPQAQDAYLILREKLFEKEGVKLTVHKMQISYSSRRVFVCVWHPPVKRLGEKAIMVSICLPWALESPRLFGRAEPKPGRFTCHVVLNGAEELDEELMGWLEEAYMFACRPCFLLKMCKKRRSRNLRDLPICFWFCQADSAC